MANTQDTTPGGIAGLVAAVTRPLDTWGGPAAVLFLRIVIFLTFWRAGMTKLDDWDNTLLLFEYEYMVPILPVAVAAFLGTFFELVMSALILVGAFTRLAAIPLLVMSLVIQFVLGARAAAYDNFEHFFWMAILCYLIARGAGALSLDHLAAKRFGLK
ncbi:MULTISPECIES: DoxX family protein [unclassified Minwuia]|jgi:putative oxidoreductase|uniref:DoxX family protein n=1 Tax=unclassified Minwuia TaxID=2618799 RepID=UPI0024784128|nr:MULTISPECIES: DoxX family protein [unclassified Minwuia]